MSVSTADQLAIQQVIGLHGHLSDAGAFDRFGEVFTDDVIYDLTAFDAGIVRGHVALAALARELGDSNPVGHHVTNVVLTGAEGDVVTAMSKGLVVYAEGTCASVVYHDILERTAAGWRIARRRVTPRLRPLHP
ncbi:nuclear transport factor 2 family protein [Nocardia shimofusensis]|uniref:nuclear transport factor 2 family protein n=1 Tax=Nocardia shimofusensis TaxID=228596 RepID=UPI00083028E1|nr:nuclear transport factor 2 family protein [Nocardia shimofusensis]